MGIVYFSQVIGLKTYFYEYLNCTYYIYAIQLEILQSSAQGIAKNIPDWVLAKYFDPEAERQRPLIHDYQQTENQQMRCMDNTKLIDSIELYL